MVITPDVYGAPQFSDGLRLGAAWISRTPPNTENGSVPVEVSEYSSTSSFSRRSP